MLRNYKPKTRKAPWKMAQELAGHTETASGAQSPQAAKAAHGVKRFKGIPRVSERRKKRGVWAQYPEFARGVVRKARVSGRRCPVVTSIPELMEGRKHGWPISSKITECHHVFGHGPNEELLLWEPGCMGVSKEGHRWIHSNIEEARRRGWYAPEGLWNNPQKVLGIWQALAKSETLIDKMLDLCGYTDGHVRKSPKV